MAPQRAYCASTASGRVPASATRALASSKCRPEGTPAHRSLSRNPAVEYAEPDEPVTAATADQYFPRQYALQNSGQTFTNTANTLSVAGGTADADVDAVEAWSVTTGTGIKVAVLDSGVASDNDDITAKVVARANFSNGQAGEDNYGHGTHVAGIVAATANNTVGVAGVCPGCTILDGKVLNDSGVGSSSALANGINWAVSSGAKVINMSLGVRASRTLETAVNNAWSKGVVLVAAAGNGGGQTKIYPAAYPNVIAVAATDNNDAKASFSTYGASWVDVAAPGVNVYSTFPNHTFVLGTQNNRSLGTTSGTAPRCPRPSSRPLPRLPGAPTRAPRTRQSVPTSNQPPTKYLGLAPTGYMAA